MVCTSLVTDVNQWLVSRMSRLPGFPWGGREREGGEGKQLRNGFAPFRNTSLRETYMRVPMRCMHVTRVHAAPRHVSR